MALAPTDDRWGQTGSAPNGVRARALRFLSHHRNTRLALWLSAPMLWLGLLYFGSLATMLVASFWSLNDFTSTIQRTFTLANYQELFTTSVYARIAARTIGIAAAVTVIDLLLALPVAFFMAKVVRSSAVRAALVVAVSMPLWANYLVKGYAWRIISDTNGVLDWLLKPLGLHGPGLGVVATTAALAYLWLPYMILPVYAGLERLPVTLLDASTDLGAGAAVTFRRVVIPLLFPAIVAGSIFTFSLTLGDYIMVKIVGGATQMFANVVYDNIGVAGNLPFAAAAAVFPIILVIGYLTAVRRTGALENL